MSSLERCPLLRVFFRKRLHCALNGTCAVLTDVHKTVGCMESVETNHIS